MELHSIIWEIDKFAPENKIECLDSVHVIIEE